MRLAVQPGTIMKKHQEEAHRFGGDWTTMKLEVLRKYLNAYTTALKKQRFKLGYIDAFAGTGYRVPRDTESPSNQESLLQEPEKQQLLKGSALIALETVPPFSRYIFIEKDADRCKHLENIKKKVPHHAARIIVRQGEANQQIKELCSKNWSNHRAVLFLDPYGMQVEWSTLEAIAATEAIDLWLLFPFGIGVNRLLTKNGEIPKPWQNRLDLLLGTHDWYDEFYKEISAPTLFEPDHTERVKMGLDVVQSFVTKRLADLFPGVAEPGVLRNSVGNPMYLFFFAASNKKGSTIALKIARHLLKGII